MAGENAPEVAVNSVTAEDPEVIENDCTRCLGSGSCGKCDGSGVDKNDDSCKHCEGSGDCPDCEGSGSK